MEIILAIIAVLAIALTIISFFHENKTEKNANVVQIISVGISILALIALILA